MKKYVLIAIILVAAAFYLGLIIDQKHPIDTLYVEAINSINQAEAIKFKSLLVVGTPDGTVHYRRQGIYDVSSGDLNYLNVANYQFAEDDPRNKEEGTSFSFEAGGTLKMLPIQEAYYCRPLISMLDRGTQERTESELTEFTLLELLPFDADIINRQVMLQSSENRGKFVVYSFTVDTEYLSKHFPRILLADGLDFTAVFVDANIKILVYPDTTLTRRVFSDFTIQSKETGERYQFQLDSYFFDNEDKES
jgi:hypothetical protein